jgi:zeaxanthin glucosyltransferase
MGVNVEHEEAGPKGRIGFFCFPAVGHLNPAIALGCCLRARGYEVTFFYERRQTEIVEPPVRAAGLRLWPFDGREWSLGVTGQRRLGKLAEWSEHVEELKRHATAVLDGAPDALRAAKIDALLVDQADLAAGSVADHLKLPFVTVSFFPPLHLDNHVPPTIFGWFHRVGWTALIRNYVGNMLLNRMVATILRVVNDYRRSWALPEFHHINDTPSTLGLVAQLPRALEFPRPTWPKQLFYAGPFRDPRTRSPVEFPWDRLNGKPLIYASIGTEINNRFLRSFLFRTIQQACMGLDMQLVLSLGGGKVNADELCTSARDTVVVRYAPQLELLARARLTITHAGLNTTLESLAEGVPLVAIPVASDQPGVAARIHWAGVGAVVPYPRLTATRLRRAIDRVMRDPSYRLAALRMKTEIKSVNGVERAAEHIDRVLKFVPVAPNVRSA